MRVFVDTSGLFAAMVKNEERHVVARQVLDTLLVERAELFSTSYVIAETMALLQTRVGVQAALSFERDLRPLLQIVWIDEPLHQRAVEKLRGEQRRQLSLVDCASFATMRKLDLKKCFALDKHFEEQGFEGLIPAS
jgi:uncharacterized protein